MGQKFTITEQERKQIQEMYYDSNSPRGIGARGNTSIDKLNTKTDFTGKKRRVKNSTESKPKEKERNELENQIEELKNKIQELKNKMGDAFTVNSRDSLENEINKSNKELQKLEDKHFDREQKLRTKRELEKMFK